ncbi:MAG: carbon-nitrogen hydrolase family protein [Anaerolineae bacterium]|nr:carbon-nitrogen hydrolase family protein [Anaerolineae bacterium]
MDGYRIACAQFEAASGAKDENVTRMIGLARQAQEQGCGLVLFPELSLSGYLAAELIPALAEAIDGPSVGRLAEAARALDINMAFGMAELDAQQGLCYNSMLVLDRQGKVACVYHKIHLWDTEREWATAGDQVPLFELDGVRFSGWICYDTRFPEVARAAALAGAEVALVSTAWLGPVDEWRLALRARALDNSMFVAGADIINHDPALRCQGVSLIVDPRGRVLARAQLDREGIVYACLSGEVRERQCRRLALLENRRIGFV